MTRRVNSLSIVIPALNEERFLGGTLGRVGAAIEFAKEREPALGMEVIVVDNASTDRTSAVAHEHGAQVIHEMKRNIGHVRNRGAHSANGDILLFLDADTLIPEQLIHRVVEVMNDPDCWGGAVELVHQPKRLLMKLYLLYWRVTGRLMGMAQGAAQFYRREVFEELGGYEVEFYMGEDVEFYWSVKRAARKQGKYLRFLTDLGVVPSPRRFDNWPLWKTLLLTNPLVILLFRRRPGFWRGWTHEVPR